MNHLGHLWTAYPDPNLLLGSLLGDVVKGDASTRFEPSVWQGIKLHRNIDHCVDTHTESGRLRRDMPKAYQRFTGLVLDVHLDHVLARSFHQYSSDSIATVLRHTLEVARNSTFSGDLTRQTRWISGPGDPTRFAERDMVLRSIDSLNGRLRFRNIEAPNMLQVYDALCEQRDLEASCEAIIASCRIVADTFHPSNSHV